MAKENVVDALTTIFEEISQEMCDKYCKYPEQYKGDNPDWCFEAGAPCQDCPMMRLVI